MSAGKLKQILLITDGCSNQGEDPVAMAALAKEKGITVNVIGVMENDVIDEKGLLEIERIAAFGRWNQPSSLCRTIIPNCTNGY